MLVKTTVTPLFIAKMLTIALPLMTGLIVTTGALWVFLHQPADRLIKREPHRVPFGKEVEIKAQALPAIASSTPLPDLIPNFTIPSAEDGMAPVLYRIPTDLPVVYLGIDDGAYKDQEVVDLLKENNIKASLFLADIFIQSDRDFFKKIIDNGSYVENHTTNHDTTMSTKSYDYQKNEICTMADTIQSVYGRRPTLFRPPGGSYTDTTRRAAHDCGMKAVVTWIAKANGGAMQYQIGNSLRPGDIVLMHFRPEFRQDLDAFLSAMHAAGLQTELLEDLPGAA